MRCAYLSHMRAALKCSFIILLEIWGKLLCFMTLGFVSKMKEETRRKLNWENQLLLFLNICFLLENE